MIKNIVKIMLSWIGYELHGTKWPVEFSEEDVELADKVLQKRLTMVSRARLAATISACKYVCECGVDGDFVECGVWRGGNSLAAASIFKRYSVRRAVWLFDTFEGMTEPMERDVPASGTRGRDGLHGGCCCSLENVRRSFSEFDLLSDSIFFVQGDVIKTLSNADGLPKRISVLRLDTDWHASTAKELEVLYDRIEMGGVLLIDDYGHWSGARQAVDEFFAKRKKPFLNVIDYTGRMAVKVE